MDGIKNTDQYAEFKEYLAWRRRDEEAATRWASENYESFTMLTARAFFGNQAFLTWSSQLIHMDEETKRQKLQTIWKAIRRVAEILPEISEAKSSQIPNLSKTEKVTPPPKASPPEPQPAE